jgi:hypothetical protein
MRANVVITLRRNDFVARQTDDKRVRERCRERACSGTNERPLQGREYWVTRTQAYAAPSTATLGLG